MGIYTYVMSNVPGTHHCTKANDSTRQITTANHILMEHISTHTHMKHLHTHLYTVCMH